jgi:hypothetical protein
MKALRTLATRALGIRAMTVLRISAVLTLIGLALMAWSMLQPTPLPVMLAMTVGQGIGCMAFGLYLFVVIRDIRRGRPEQREQPGSREPS